MAKKQLIMEKALELFAKQGFEATSVQQITEHCGISKGAFYLSFKSKDELILALIDHFMMQFLSEIDYVVRNSNNENLLYDFYFTAFQSFHKHSDFAKLLMKEQAQTINEEFIHKMYDFNRMMEKIIITMIERLYSEEIRKTKYDLMYCIKGFIQTYSNLFVFYNVPLDLELLAHSLVEKTNVLAKHVTLPFMTEDLYQIFTGPEYGGETKEQIIQKMEQLIEEVDDPIIKESLLLLKNELIDPSLSPAIVKGLLQNIRQHPHCKWIPYLIDRYFEFL
ncbi:MULTISPECIES: TetR/AcrR family transcriptional regulator [Neobacillus]|jgi:AcrR family transcriptional regulator|uniref:TetR/AcrR family transcriptional regulator n=1 Tax=Neobacillus TaxID=2675232 RepID=UPI0004F83B28|nr:TetR/AcrR family transcriptional regulator [Neobacillus sedimentimangrovi]AIM15182.1 transcriptional regulator [Bacillus sp. X1(2014)]